MKHRFLGYALLGAATCAMLVVAQLPISAQLAGSGKAAPDGGKGGKGGGKGGFGGGRGKGPPAEPTKHIATVEINQPDFGGPGVWNVPYITNMGAANYMVSGGKEMCEEFANGAGGSTPTCAPFNEKGKKVFARRRETDSATDPEGFCIPPGTPRMMYTPYPMKMLQEPKEITFIFEGGTHIWRQIPLIAKKEDLKHSKDPNPTYLGEGIGWFEGDTLVIDTIGFNDRTWLDFAGHPHGEKLHVVERFTRLDSNTLEDVAMIEDPEYYTKPWTVRTTATYQPTNQLLEYICQENEADSKHQMEMLKRRGIDPATIP